MSWPRQRSRSVLLAAALLLAALATSAGLGSQRSAAVATAGTASPARIRMSVDYLTHAYHVSTVEAVRRLRLQHDAVALDDRLARELPDAYGGMWLDQRHGGRLMVAMVRPRLLTGMLRGFSQAAAVQPVAVAHSWAELQRLAGRVPARLAGQTVHAGVDETRNRVVVLTAGRRAGVRAALDRLGLRAPTVTVGTAHRGTDVDCSPWDCRPPLHGALRLTMTDNLWHVQTQCSTGYNVVGSNGWNYTLTAGHCMTSSTWYYAKVNWSSHPSDPAVGARVNGFVRIGFSYPNDGMIMPYVNGSDAAFWMPKGAAWNLVDDYACSESTKSCYTWQDFPIKGYYTLGQIRNGWTVCASGQSHYTSCGEVTSTLSGGIETNICRIPGDSGGPLYSQIDNMAYGITNQSVQGCTSYPSWSSYTALSNIFTKAHNQTGITYWLAGTPRP